MIRQAVNRLSVLALLALLGSVAPPGAIASTPSDPLPAGEPLASPASSIDGARTEKQSKPPLAAADFSLPLGVLRIGDRHAAMPDWRLITFSDLPALASDGTFGDVSWRRGDAIAEILTVGDLQGGFDIHLLTLAAIAEQLGLRSRQGRGSGIGVIPLDEFGLLNHQTLSSLVGASPTLLSLKVGDSELVKDLIAIVDPTFVASNATTLGDLLKQYPKYGEISLSYLDLSEYTLSDLPKIELAPIQTFSQWESAKLSDIPLLEHLTLWTLPGKINVHGEIATAAVEEAEGGALEAVFLASGANPGRERLLRWRPGQRQVGGVGSGDIATINGGIEPLGAVIYNASFKVVPHRVSTGEIQLVAYFRSCRQSGDGTAADCSPYGIGPIPFMTVKPGEPVFLGTQAFGAVPYSPDAAPPPAPTPEEPTRVAEAIEALADNPGQVGLAAFLSTLAIAGAWWLLKAKPKAQRNP